MPSPTVCFSTINESLEFSLDTEGKELNCLLTPPANLKRSRIEEFRANNCNSANVNINRQPNHSYVTHVLCCPSCPFMSLQVEVMASHANSQHSIASLIVYRCELCQAASTQRDIMEEHMFLYHNSNTASSEQSGLQLVTTLVPCHTISDQDSASVHRQRCSEDSQVVQGSRKRKCHVPVRHLSASTNVDDETRSPLAPLDLSLKSSQVANQAVEQHPRTDEASNPSISASLQSVELIKPRTAQQHQPPHHNHSGSSKPQRQNFTEAQNCQLQAWFLDHKDKPYPSTADTRHLSVITGLNYSQVKKWFANRRMRTKAVMGAGFQEGKLNEDSTGKEGSSCSQHWSSPPRD